MASITTYAELKAAAQQWLNRNDQSAIDAIPLCIGFAEQDFHRTIKLPTTEFTLEYAADATLPDTIGKIVLPNDYYEAKHLTVNGQPYTRVSVEIFNRIRSGEVKTSTSYFWDNTGNHSSSNFFARIGDEIHTLPLIVDQDIVQLIYFEDLENHQMNADADTSEFLRFGPDIMLYLTLRHAAFFLRDNEQAQFWQAKAEEAGSRLMGRLDEIEWSGSAYIVPEFSR